MTKFLQPSDVRLSESFLLSDFMGCDSVYRLGFCNRFQKNEEKMEHGLELAALLDSVQGMLGPLSISYGFIDPALSTRIVSYQDPNKPSYHRWDFGAAADICLHEHVQKEDCSAPVLAALEIDAELPYSRMITYAESPWICLAARANESPAREVFYENRYLPHSRKPRFIKHTTNKHFPLGEDVSNWQGRGYPSYHGGGRLQYHHVRVSEYTMLSDFLYNEKKVFCGSKNIPRVTIPKYRDQAGMVLKAAGALIDRVVTEVGQRVSITDAIDGVDDWVDTYHMTIVPPSSITPEALLQIVDNHEGVKNCCLTRRGKRTKRPYGVYVEGY